MPLASWKYNRSEIPCEEKLAKCSKEYFICFFILAWWRSLSAHFSRYSIGRTDDFFKQPDYSWNFIFFFFVLLEIILSKKAGVSQKLIFSILYATVPLAGYFLLPALVLLLVLFIAGNTYLNNLRGKFMFQMEKRK